VSDRPVAVALGSNLGDREGYLRTATTLLGAYLRDLKVSPFFDTDPVGVGPQPRFLNGAAVGYTPLSARELLEKLLDTEKACGRHRPAEGAPRTLDLDLIFYDQVVLNEPGLIVPHPRFRTREFVLAPLAVIASAWRDPVSGLTVGELLDRVRRSPQ
jgi:2-amino-4-hydroxy-6-hydroxymethyldihydropteridine diphosphokinase